MSEPQQIERIEGWQPFATAPKDRPVLTWNCIDPMDGHKILEWYTVPSGGSWIDSGSGHIVEEPYLPTHWHELPAGPSS